MTSLPLMYSTAIPQRYHSKLMRNHSKKGETVVRPIPLTPEENKGQNTAARRKPRRWNTDRIQPLEGD